MRPWMLALLLVSCTGRTTPDEAPRRWSEDTRVSGEATAGFGASVAWTGSTLWVGEPWGGAGRVVGSEGRVLTGLDGDRFGETLLGGEQLLIGAPGRGDGAGAVLDARSDVLLAGEPGENFGGAPTLHEGGLVAVGNVAVRGAASRWEPPGPVWSLISLRLSAEGETSLVAGLLSGGVAWPGSVRSADGGLGRGILACDLDEDGDDDLVLSDPLEGRVLFFVVDELTALNLESPTHSLSLGPGAGRSLACFRGGVWVGAPDLAGGGAVAWFRRPLDANADDAVWIRGGAGSRLGHAMSVGEDRIAVGDPGLGEARVLIPSR